MLVRWLWGIMGGCGCRVETIDVLEHGDAYAEQDEVAEESLDWTLSSLHNIIAINQQATYKGDKPRCHG